MERIIPEHIDGEEVYTITTLDETVDETAVIMGAAEHVLDPGYAFCPDDLDQRDRRNVDIIL